MYCWTPPFGAWAPRGGRRHGERWRYGILRFTSADPEVALDGRQVAAYDKFNARGRTDGPYHSAARTIAMDP
jgi:hypothetical protein